MESNRSSMFFVNVCVCFKHDRGKRFFMVNTLLYVSDRKQTLVDRVKGLLIIVV